MPLLSGSRPRTSSYTPISLQPLISPPLPPRERVLPNGSFIVDRIDSSPNDRAGAGGGSSTSIQTIGAPPDQDARSARLASAVDSNNSAGGTVTDTEAAANASALSRMKQGVLGCVGKNSAPSGDCGDCNTIDCLTKLLTGNLLDADAKKLLCDMIGAAERAAKNSIDSAGNALLRAAQNLTSAAALKAPLNTLGNFINNLDPGAVAKCFGADQLKSLVNGKLNDVNRVISNAEKGVHDKLAKAFNKATNAAQQFSLTPNLCNSGGPASLRSLF